MTPGGASAPWRIRSIESSSRSPPSQTFANATARPLALHERDRQCATGRRDRTQPTEKRFSRVFFSASQESEMPLELVEPARHLGRLQHREAEALAHHPVVRGAQRLARAARERELRERHARLLAELARRRGPGRGRAAGPPRRLRRTPPNRPRRRRARGSARPARAAPRAARRDRPSRSSSCGARRTSGTPCRPRGRAAALSPSSARCALVLRDAATIGSARSSSAAAGRRVTDSRRAQQRRQHRKARDAEPAHQRAQRARRVALELELPPELARVLDVRGTRARAGSPCRRARRARAQSTPARTAGGTASCAGRRSAGTAASASDHRREQRRLLPVEPLQQRRDGARAPSSASAAK